MGYKEDCPSCIGDGYYDLDCPYCDGDMSRLELLLRIKGPEHEKAVILEKVHALGTYDEG